MQREEALISEKFITPTWPAPKNVHALATLREVELSDLDLPSEPFWIKQVHGAEVVIVENSKSTATTPEADGVLTFAPNTVCLVRTADCLPVFLCDQQGTQVAVVHCGWRSLAANILQTTCNEFTAAMSDCMVWLGPAIGPQAFEVGKEVIDGFAAHGWTDAHLAAGFIPHPTNPGKWLGDLYTLARLTLQRQGIPAEKIYGGDWCTYSDSQRFYSYRRSKDAGRMFNIIWRTD